MCSYIKGLTPMVGHIKSHTSETLQELWSVARFRLTLLSRTLMRANGNPPFQSPCSSSSSSPQHNTFLFSPLSSSFRCPTWWTHYTCFETTRLTKQNSKLPRRGKQAFPVALHSPSVIQNGLALCIHWKISLMQQKALLASRFLFICSSKLPHYMVRRQNNEREQTEKQKCSQCQC